MKTLKPFFLAIALCATLQLSRAQEHYYHGGHGHQVGNDSNQDEPKLHVNPRWRECSFQLDADLSQSEWREFTREAGLVVSFRSLTDAKPLGARNFEVSVLKWSTAIDEGKGAWNDTFVHPDSTHWLVGGPRLPIMGLTGRMGITDRLDIGLYITRNPGANYGFFGAQLQYNFFQSVSRKWSASARGSFVRMYGPDDLNLTVYHADIVASREFVVHEKWLRVSPYVVLSTYVSASREKSDVVDLKNESVIGAQGSAGVVAKVAFGQIGVEYNVAEVNTVSLKVGATF